MALSDATKVDYLWKKLGYGLTKTAPPANKEAFNESIPSPLLMRADKVWQSSGSIPAVKPSADTSIITVYQDAAGGSATVETTEDLTAPDNRTWKTGLTDWVPTEFGSTYLVKVYVDTAGAAAPQSTGTQLFQAGSGNNDEWFFDYQSGVLNFNGTNIPSVIGTGVTGKSVYIVGARYTGPFGVGGGNAIGNLTVTDTTIGTSASGANIILQTTSQGTVQIDNTTAFNVSVGNSSQRPSTPVTGDLRFNTTLGQLEVYSGSGWDTLGSDFGTITSDTFAGDNSTVAFTLSSNSTTAGTVVSINGTVQEPTSAYAVSGNVITFTEAPAVNDTIEARIITGTTTVTGIQNTSANAAFTVSGSSASSTVTGDLTITGNLAVTGSVTGDNTLTGNLTVEGAIKSDTFYYVRRSTNTSITYPGSYGSVTIDYEDAEVDYGSTDAMWSSATDRFTPTVAGLWYFRASVDAYSGATQEGGIAINLNGSTNATTGTIGAIRPMISAHIYMDGSTDYVTFSSYTQSATTRAQAAASSWFEALLVKQAE